MGSVSKRSLLGGLMASTALFGWANPALAEDQQQPGDVIVNGQKMNLLSMGQPQTAPQKK